MGKIRIRTLGNEKVEKEQQKEAKKRQEQKSARLAKVPGLKGGQRIVAVGPSEKELEQLSVLDSQLSEKGQPVTSQSVTDKQTTDKLTSENIKQKTDNTRAKNRKERTRSKSYQVVAKLIDKAKIYSLQDALNLIPKIHLSTFDETVELHINTIDKGISATVTLPHGTGKKVRVAIADDTIIENVAKGKIDFDVLLSEPSFMPKLARVAKFLGPKGLMPNPKNDTISNNPKELAKKYEGGQITLKTEAKAPIMHLTIGKLSFGKEKLMENIKVVLNAVKSENIRKITLKSTMSPGIRIQLD